MFNLNRGHATSGTWFAPAPYEHGNEMAMQAAIATPLSTTQERRLVEFLEEQFLELTRGYKKRSNPT